VSNLGHPESHIDFSILFIDVLPVNSFAIESVIDSISTSTPAITSGIFSVTSSTKELEPSLTFDDDSYQNLVAESDLGLVGNTVFSMPISLTCSTGGNLDISYSIVQSGPDPVPNWVGIDALDSLLVGTAPVVQEDTTFTFFIQADSIAWSSGYQKSIDIKVLKCNCNVVN
jgi:hypothetical protein